MIGTQNYIIKEGVVFAQCLNKVPSIYFLFSGLWLELRGDDFLVDVSPDQDRSLCQLMLFQNILDMNVFGTPIFKGYYAIHDPKNDKIGFAPLSKSPKLPLRIGEVPLA